MSRYYYNKFKNYQRADNRKFDQNKGRHGYVYLLENRPNDFAYKIGHTTRHDVNDRVREINQKYGGFYAYKPANYFCIHKVHTIDCYTAEQLVHKELDSFRVMPKFELFEFKTNRELEDAKAVIHRICMQVNGQFSESVIIVPPYVEEVEPVAEQEPKVFEGLILGSSKKPIAGNERPRVADGIIINTVKPEVVEKPAAKPISEKELNEILDKEVKNRQPPKPSRIAVAWDRFKSFMNVAVRVVVYGSLVIIGCIALWFIAKPTHKENAKLPPVIQQAPEKTRPIVTNSISTYDAEYEKQLIEDEEKMLRDYNKKQIKQSLKKTIKTKNEKIKPVEKLSEFEELKIKTQQSIKNRIATETPIDAYKERVKSNLNDITSTKQKYCFKLESGELKCY